jgi:hypothetical protein
MATMRAVPAAGRGSSGTITGGLALAAAAWVGCASSPGPSPAAPVPDTDIASVARRSSAADRQRVALTIYNSNFALVREERRLALGTGRIALAYEDVSAHVEPATVHLRSLDDPGSLAVLEQNYRYDVLTPETLLLKYVGRPLTIARYNEKLGEDERRNAELVAVENGPVLRVDGELVAGSTDRFIFPELPPSLLERPTLVWLLDSQRAQQRVEVSYLTSNLSWRADYVLVLDASTTRGDLSSWVTLENQSGTSFNAAELKLVAGNVQRVEPPAPPPQPVMEMEERRVATNGGLRQEPLFEYHLYALGRPADVLDKEQKQVSLLEARGVSLRQKLQLRGSHEGHRMPWREPETTQKVSAFVVLDNSEASGLGMPLPAGTMRVYKADSSGSQQFVGEDAIDHTPRDEKLEIRLGEAFDIVGDRRQTSFRVLGRCSSESAWRIEIRNHKSEATPIEVLEPVSGDTEVLESSHPVARRDAQSFAFDVDVPAGGALLVTYRVKVRWC